MQRYLQLAELMTQEIFDKLAKMYHNKQARKVKLTKENLLQASIFKLTTLNKQAAQNAYLEYLDLINNATQQLSATAIKNTALLITNKHYLLSKVSFNWYLIC